MVNSIKRVRQKKIGKYWVVKIIESIPNKLYILKLYDLSNQIVYEPKIEKTANEVLEIYNNITKVKNIQERIALLNSRKMTAREQYPIKYTTEYIKLKREFKRIK